MSLLIPIIIGLALALCVIARVIISECQKAPVASRAPLPDAGGPRGRLDPIPGQAAHWPRPSPDFEPQASGRGHHGDHYANGVAATITHDRVTVDVDHNNRARIHRIRRLRADGRGV